MNEAIADYERLQGATEFVGILSDVPALPQVLLELIPLLDDPDVDMAEVASLASRDPGLTSRLLRLANSPAFQRHRESETVAQAIGVLGLRQVKVAAAFACLEVARSAQSRAASPEIHGLREILWRHSLCTAIGASHLARVLKKPYVEELFVCGLLHDLGKFAMLQTAPLACVEVGAKVGAGEDCCKAEDEVLGFSHPIVGALLSHRWCFALDTCEVIRLHHETRAEATGEQNSEKVAIVCAADLIAHHAGHGYRAAAPMLVEELRLAFERLSLGEEELELLQKEILREFEWQTVLA